MSHFISVISNKSFPMSQCVYAHSINKSIRDLIEKDCPNFDDNSKISLVELNNYRKKYIEKILNLELDHTKDLDKMVMNSLTQNETISDKIEHDGTISLGQRLADKVASFGGSWSFIIMFGGFIFIWIIVNSYLIFSKSFDPFPFILLNLILSCIAAIQAPIIMMSQNRQEEKDRERAKKDYMINLKAELEIRTLHDKIDHLILYQQQQLMETQKVQIEMLSEMYDKLK